MIVRTLQKAEQVTLLGNTNARMLVSSSDGVGHIVIDTTINPGTVNSIESEYLTLYSTQACYCINGTGIGTVEGIEYQLKPDTLIATTSRKPIVINSDSNMRFVVIFCMGTERPVTIARNLDETKETERDIFWGNGRSRRLLIRKDGMGFALCNTIGNANTDSLIQYRNHFESCYYLSGTGEYEWKYGKHAINTGKEQATVFIMNKHDTHYMRIRQQSTCLSIFTPPIEGDERHDFSNEEASSY